jgi:hypothetical protein
LRCDWQGEHGQEHREGEYHAYLVAITLFTANSPFTHAADIVWNDGFSSSWHNHTSSGFG